MDKIPVITVYYQGGGIMLHAHVAKELGYKGGEELNEAQAWEALTANATLMLAVIEKERSNVQ